MPPDPEALAQLARLLGDESLRSGDPGALHFALENGTDSVADGLLNEAASSDDVTDRESALAFVEDRVRFLGNLLTETQTSRLREAVRGKIEAW